MSSFPAGIEALLLSGYVLFSSLLNLMALLISAFYHKKFNQASPKAGFIIAITLAIVFIVVLFIGDNSVPFQITFVFALLGSGVASALSITGLFFTMRRIRK